jgi:hypothetical protein
LTSEKMIRLSYFVDCLMFDQVPRNFAQCGHQGSQTSMTTGRLSILVNTDAQFSAESRTDEPPATQPQTNHAIISDGTLLKIQW